MAEAQRLLASLKQELKRQNLTYRDVATALGLSEASVKRLFASGRFTVHRLIEIATLVGLTLAELAQEAATQAPRVHELSEEQERALVSDIKLVLVAVCALNQWSMADIVATYRLSETECLKRLLHLDRLGLIQVLPGNRIRVTVARDFDWRPNGPIRRFFRDQGQDDFVRGSDFTGADEAIAFVHGMLDASGVAAVQTELRALRRKLVELHESCLALPLRQKHGVGLLLALREWELPAFSTLRRPAR